MFSIDLFAKAMPPILMKFSSANCLRGSFMYKVKNESASAEKPWPKGNVLKALTEFSCIQAFIIYLYWLYIKNSLYSPKTLLLPVSDCWPTYDCLLDLRLFAPLMDLLQPYHLNHSVILAISSVQLRCCVVFSSASFRQCRDGQESNT